MITGAGTEIFSRRAVLAVCVLMCDAPGEGGGKGTATSGGQPRTSFVRTVTRRMKEMWGGEVREGGWVENWQGKVGKINNEVGGRGGKKKN